MQPTEFIWFDGKMVPFAEANVHVLSHCLHYGTGVFEGIRCYKCTDGTSAVFRLEEHVQRLFNSMKIIGLQIPHTEKAIYDAILETLKVNKLAEGYVRPLSFVGYGGVMGIHPKTNPIHTIIAVWPWGAYLGADALTKGISIKTSSFTRHQVNATMTKAKVSGNYVNSVLAKMEAVTDGYEEALMLDTNGFVSEATGENIFIVRNNIIKTTPLTSILGGITRDSIMEIAREAGYTVLEQQFTRDELYTADEAFFTGTAAELTPISSVDRRVIGEGKAGKVSLELQEKFFAAAQGDNPNYAKWLSRYSV